MEIRFICCVRAVYILHIAQVIHAICCWYLSVKKIDGNGIELCMCCTRMQIQSLYRYFSCVYN